jgi:hypothetical protein
MLDVFTEEDEVLIKDGISNLYWYKDDLKKAWLRSGVNPILINSLFALRNEEGKILTKRQLMYKLYEKLRNEEYNIRLEISRNFVKILYDHENFSPQDKNHRIEVAERCALKLREKIRKQRKEQEAKDYIKRTTKQSNQETYSLSLLKVRERFDKAILLKGQKRGYELEKIFQDLMKSSGILVEKPFKIEGEQIDGAIKHDGHYYLIELKWEKSKCNQMEIASLYLKVEGKMDARGIFIAMEGYSSEVLASLPKGKEIKVLLLNGVHFANVIYGIYTFQELINHAIQFASVRGDIYCPTAI